nr:cell wall-binding repeat-containing protein [Ornithinimicrobium cavernae]
MAGGNRYETAAQMALPQYEADRVYLTSGTGWADAVSVGAVAGDNDALLLTKSDQLPQATSAALSALDPSEVIIVGGRNAVAGGITAEVRAAAPGAAVTRVAGADRYETAAELAAEYGDLTGNVVVATGADFADALSAGQLGDPLLLTHPGHLTQATATALSDASSVTIIGGHLAVSSKTEHQLLDVLGR